MKSRSRKLNQTVKLMVHVIYDLCFRVEVWSCLVGHFCLLTRFFPDLRIANPSKAKLDGQKHMLCSLIGWCGGGVSCKYPRYCRWFWLVRFSAKTLCFFSFHIFGWRDTEFPIIEYILYSKCYLYLYIVTLKMMSWLGVYIPGTCLSPILGLQPSKTRSFPIKTGVVWVPGMHINIYVHTIYTLNMSVIYIYIHNIIYIYTYLYIHIDFYIYTYVCMAWYTFFSSSKCESGKL